eukprot:TRINITY_DN1488_c0_g1_i1.p1 TRINITY_DN1488_c0_g1~~TRINITY_DN1488_c0_g1_i1.p1  ORF type:complete len:654 (-),score=275.45 TRINITY_DN1488_c0_g1_i1:131-2092(-)
MQTEAFGVVYNKLLDKILKVIKKQGKILIYSNTITSDFYTFIFKLQDYFSHSIVYSQPDLASTPLYYFGPPLSPLPSSSTFIKKNASNNSSYYELGRVKNWNSNSNINSASNGSGVWMVGWGWGEGGGNDIRDVGGLWDMIKTDSKNCVVFLNSLVPGSFNYDLFHNNLNNPMGSNSNLNSGGNIDINAIISNLTASNNNNNDNGGGSGGLNGGMGAMVVDDVNVEVVHIDMSGVNDYNMSLQVIKSWRPSYIVYQQGTPSNLARMKSAVDRDLAKINNNNVNGSGVEESGVTPVYTISESSNKTNARQPLNKIEGIVSRNGEMIKIKVRGESMAKIVGKMGKDISSISTTTSSSSTNSTTTNNKATSEAKKEGKEKEGSGSVVGNEKNIKGLLVRKDFVNNIMYPEDLNVFTPLSVTEIWQTLYMKWSGVDENKRGWRRIILSALEKLVLLEHKFNGREKEDNNNNDNNNEENKEEEEKKEKVEEENCIKVEGREIQIKYKKEEERLKFEWKGGGINDMIVDSIISHLMGTEESGGEGIKAEEEEEKREEETKREGMEEDGKAEDEVGRKIGELLRGMWEGEEVRVEKEQGKNWVAVLKIGEIGVRVTMGKRGERRGVEEMIDGMEVECEDVGIKDHIERTIHRLKDVVCYF